MKKILIIEDNEAINRMLNRYLAKEGHTVKSLSNADNIPECIRNENYDIVFFEPKLHWMDIIDKIKILLPEIKFIAMIGGYEDEKLFMELEKEGITASVQKPFELKEIKQIINFVQA